MADDTVRLAEAMQNCAGMDRRQIVVRCADGTRWSWSTQALYSAALFLLRRHTTVVSVCLDAKGANGEWVSEEAPDLKTEFDRLMGVRDG